MDKEDLLSPDAIKIINELNNLIILLHENGCFASSWYGKFKLDENPSKFEKINRGYSYKALKDISDDINFPWFLYWEIYWIVKNGEFKASDKILDLGGSSSLFSYYLAHKGYDVTTVDVQDELVANANLVAEKMHWNLKNIKMDMSKLTLNNKFTHITSICVFEHIPMYERIKINKSILQLLEEKGRFSITIDYKNPSRFASINNPEDVRDQFIIPSGLKIRENEMLYDNNKRYLLHPFYYKYFLIYYKWRSIKKGHFKWYEFFKIKFKEDYTFAAIFLEK